MSTWIPIISILVILIGLVGLVLKILKRKKYLNKVLELLFMKILLFTLIVLTAAMLVMILATEFSVNSLSLSDSSDMADINLKANVFVSKNGELIYEGHNVLTNAGKDYLKLALGNAEFGSNAFKYIAVGNGSAPTASSTSLNSEINEAGLSRSAGSYSSTGTGSWKIEKIFSVTGSVSSINSTALFNASSSGTMLAGDTFTNTNVANGDSLNITWTITVS